jgi:anti-sigma factor RsiW
VKRIHPGGVTSDDLIAFIDGEAPAEVVEHVRGCSTCGPLVGEYVETQSGLRARLRRFDCPPPHELGEYDLGLLGPEARTAVAAHVVDCPRCADELRQLRDFLQIGAPAPVDPVARVRRLVAALLAPPGRGAYAALRGADDATPATYAAGDVTITLEPVAGTRPGQAGLAGLAWREEAPPETLAGSIVVLVADDGTTRTTALDDLGNFAFDDIPPGTYHVEVALGDDTVAIEGLQIGH